MLVVKSRKTPLGQANAFVNALKELNAKSGYDLLNLEHLILREEVDSNGNKKVTVIWEEGPYEWPLMLSGGESLFCAELGRYDLTAEITFEAGGREWEPQNHYSLSFYSF